MTTFNLGDLNDWQPLGVGELVAFDLPDNGYRLVMFDVMASGPCSAHAVTTDNAWCVGAGLGFYACRFSTDRPVAVSFVADEGTEIYIRTRAATQVLPEDPEVSFVNIQPRTAGPSDEVSRMMRIMALNMQHREAQLIQDMQRMIDERGEAPVVLVEPAEAPQAAATTPQGGDTNA